MAVTLADLDAELHQNLGPLAALVNLRSVGAWACREMGYAVAGAASLTDAELAAVPAADTNQLYELGRMEVAQRVLDNLDPLQLKEVGVTEDVDKLRSFWLRRVAALRAGLADRYGYGTGTVSLGSIDLGFAAYDGTSSS